MFYYYSDHPQLFDKEFCRDKQKRRKSIKIFLRFLELNTFYNKDCFTYTPQIFMFSSILDSI